MPDKVEIQRYEGKYWGYAYVRVHAEKKVSSVISDMGLPVYVPCVPHARMHHSSKVISYVPMFAGYVFLCVSESERVELKKKEERIVQIHLQLDPRQEAQLMEELRILQRCEELAQTEKILVNPGIQKGDRVLVKNGPLAGLETEVIDRGNDEDSIIINLSMLGHYVECVVSAELLKKIIE